VKQIKGLSQGRSAVGMTLGLPYCPNYNILVVVLSSVQKGGYNKNVLLWFASGAMIRHPVRRVAYMAGTRGSPRMCRPNLMLHWRRFSAFRLWRGTRRLRLCTAVAPASPRLESTSNLKAWKSISDYSASTALGAESSLFLRDFGSTAMRIMDGPVGQHFSEKRG